MAGYKKLGYWRHYGNVVSNLPVSQFYHVTTDEPHNVYGGLQDNGTCMVNPGELSLRDWTRIGQGRLG
jgi:hypothetical protein